MAGGGFVVDNGDFGGRTTAMVIITCIVAASGGLIFGYDIGISGGVTTMVPFLEKFFPLVIRKAADAKTNVYCVYDSQLLTAFTSSLYIYWTILSPFTKATPVYLSEVAPAKWRGSFSTGFQFFIGIGVLAANCINYATSKHKSGWRISLGLAIVPALIMTLGAFLITDTPSSLVERGKIDEAKRALTKVRGKDGDIDAELMALTKASEAVKEANREPFVTIFGRQYRPHLVMAVMIPFFQQVTGINVIAFYAPVLFQSVGFGSNSALIAAIILGGVNLGSILVSTFVVDRFGRRVLFLEGGVQMFICQVAVAIVLAATAGVSHAQHISKDHAILVLVLMCVYAAGFGWSWGPLSWLIPSEIFPMKIRPIGQSITVAVNFGVTFVLSQTFLTMLCHFKYGAFLFYAGWIAVMTVFVTLFVPETKGIPLESMSVV